MSARDWAEQQAREIAGRYYHGDLACKEFMSWLPDVLHAAYARGHRDGLEDASKVAEDCGRTNVENPAIDMFERQRREGIRWCGDFIVTRIRALARLPGGGEDE